MKTPLSHAFLFTLFVTYYAPAWAGIECSQEITRKTEVNGTTRIPLRKYTLNELCSGDPVWAFKLGTVKQCREELREDFKNDPNTLAEVSKKLQERFGPEAANRILEKSVDQVIDALLSNQKIDLQVKDSDQVHLGPTMYIEFKPINSMRTPTSPSYALYPNLERELGSRRATKFRHSLGGGLTQNLDEILSFELAGNFSTNQTIKWVSGEWAGPEIHVAIVADQLVITLHEELGNVSKVLTYPIPFDKKIELPFSDRKEMHHLDVQMESLYSIQCRRT